MNVTPPTSGPVAGKFQLVGLIGRGGMGSVWEGRHQTLGTRVAIKFIEAEYADSQEARSRFDREARAAATIESKHAIKIFDHGVTDDGKPFIVMELLVGEPLDKRIDRLRQLTLQDTARILQQVCRGLQRAHERGIVHRDLKPENVFLTRSSEDDDEIVKVLDFGIAKIQNSAHNAGMTSSTKTGAVLGTPYYMSPEQARGLRNVDHRTDLWSIGVIAFKCIAGKLPFDGESVGDLLVKICTAPVPVPSQVIPGLPSSFDAWFMRALERDPERRFQSAQELGDALAYAAGLSAGRGPQSLSGPQSALGPGSHNVHGGGPVPTPQPMPSPMMGTPAGGAYGARTPPPAGMTNAPFTSSTPSPTPPGGRAKVIVGAAIAGLVLGGAAITASVLLKNNNAGTRTSAGLAVSTTTTPVTTTTTPGTGPSATIPTLPQPGAEAPVGHDPPHGGTTVPLVPAKATTTAPQTRVPATKPTTKPTTTAPTAPTQTAPTAPTTQTPPVTTTPPPAPTTTVKKTPNKDPGY